MDWRFFDSEADYDILERLSLPHWGQARTLVFITWRTRDSIPQVVARRWSCQRRRWLVAHGLNPDSKTWRRELERLPRANRRDYHQRFSVRFEKLLDGSRGACLLRKSKLSKIVGDSLLHANGSEYWLTDFVVMPNHVHLLGAFESSEAMLTQCRDWKRYSATQINRAEQRAGRFWCTDSFDHLVRSEEQFRRLQSYVRENPQTAGLKDGQFLHWSNGDG